MGLPATTANSEPTGVHQIDLPQARRLSSLIATALGRLSAAPEDTDGHTAKAKDADLDALDAREAALTIASAAAQLAALVRPPEQVLLEVATGFTLSAALRLAVEAHIPEIIRALSSRTPVPNGQASSDNDSAIDVGDDHRDDRRHNEEEGVSVREIARLCGVNEDKLDRILRLLATHHIFAELPPSPSPLPSLREHSGEGEAHPAARFAHTRLSAALDSGAALADILDPDLLPFPFPPLAQAQAPLLSSGRADVESAEERKAKPESGAGEGKREGESESESEESGEEKRRKRWAAKYGAEAPGAGLAALVGLLTDDAMFNATALTDVLLYSKTKTKTSTSTSARSRSGDAKEGKREEAEPASTSTSTSAPSNDSPISTSASASAPEPKPEPAPASSDPPSSSTPAPPTDSEAFTSNVDPDTKELERDSEDEDEDSPLRAAFSHAHSLPRTTMFEWLSAPGNAHKLHRFGCAMRGMGSLTPESAILAGFDFASLPPGSTVVDVGGGVGTASLPILRACPQLKLVVQDTEEVVRVAPGFWEKQYPEALEAGRVSFQVQSFFDAQPSPSFSPSGEKGEGGKEQEQELEQGPAAFLLRMIMHNWPDAHCEKILGRLRAAAGAGTRLVLVDSVLMAACREQGGREATRHGDDEQRLGVVLGGTRRWEEAKVKEAPEPLLANWGTANGLAYRLDLIMLANHNARERTLAAFAALLAKTGWAITEVHAASESWMPQIVAVPSAIPTTPMSALVNGAEAQATVSTERKGSKEEKVTKPMEPELKADDVDEVTAEVRVDKKRFSLFQKNRGMEEKERKRKSMEESGRRGSGEKKEKEKDKKKRFSFLRGILPIRSH